MKKLIGCAAGLLLLATVLRADFVGDLTPQDQASAGLIHLAPAQISALNDLVEHDQTLAREGGVTGFAPSFSERHTSKEMAQAGLDRLTGAQRTKLDRLVAFAIAHPPQEIPHYISHPSPTAALAAPPPAALVASAPSFLKPEVHGDVSFTVGGGKGFSFYGSSMDLSLLDPAGRYFISVGLSQFNGKGPIAPYLLDPPWSDNGPYLYPLRNWAPLPPAGP